MVCCHQRSDALTWKDALTLIQPPKTTTWEAKVEAFYQHLLGSGTCFTLKELESKPPGGAAKIRSQEVKGILKSLTDEGQVKCEKIGSGNWYWTPWDNGTGEKQRAVQELTAEKLKREGSVSTMQKDIMRQEKRLPDLPALLDRVTTLQTSVREARAQSVGLQEKLSRTRGPDLLLSVEEKEKELPGIMSSLERWEDNVELVKAYMTKLSGGDRSVVDQVLRSLSGEVEEAEVGEEVGSEPDPKRVKME